jgi:hypothetical protein
MRDVIIPLHRVSRYTEDKTYCGIEMQRKPGATPPLLLVAAPGVGWGGLSPPERMLSPP